MLRRYPLAALLHALVVWTVAVFCCATIRGQTRPFSVRDSIDMVTFSDPDTRSPDQVCKLSPNHRHFFVVTTKGILAKNELESTIWLYDAQQVAAFLRGSRKVAPPPEKLLKLTAVPKAKQSDSYGSLVTKASWASDSRSILFLGETGDGTRRLYRVNVHNRRASLLSAPTADIQDFTESNGTIAYTATRLIPGGRGLNVGHPADVISEPLTGLSILNIFDPTHYPIPESYFRPIDLWVQRAGHTIRINPIEGRESWRYPVDAANRLSLALSPDGNGLIAARPVFEIESSWRHYKSFLPMFDFKKLPKRDEYGAENWNWPWEYVFVDLRSRIVYPLAAAPSASRSDTVDTLEAAWSQDGTRVVFTDTFLPIGSEAEPSQQQIPCAAGVLTIADRSSQCVAYTRLPRTDTRLRSARFGGSPHEIVLQWLTAGKVSEERYREESSTWVLSQVSDISPPADLAVTLSIRQSLNDPPTLLAADPKTGQGKELWNPNPQLASLERGLVSVFRWTDDSGYQWTAGLVKPYGYTAGRRYPLVIQTHGFNEHEFLVDGSYTTGFAAQPLAAAGIMVLQMEDRKDRHLQPTSEEASLFASGCASAIHLLTEERLIDPDRVGIVGFSRTSWYVETALVKYPNLFRAATIIDGIDQGYVNYILFCPGQRSCQNDEEGANGGRPFGRDLAQWLNSAVTFHLDKVQAPVRLETIGWDSVLEAWEIYSSLRQQDKPVDLIYMPSGQHILQKPLERYASQQGNVDWFRFWLQGDEDAEPSKRDQYVRWRKLKGSV
jgi:hypothetical protein